VAAINYTERYPTLDPTNPSPGDHFSGSELFPGGIGDNFALRATATLTVHVEGTYTLGVNSDDGVRLRIDGAQVLLDDTLHELKDTLGTVFLTAGQHELELVTFDATGTAGVELFVVRAAQLVTPDEYGLLSTDMNPSLAPWIRTDVGSELQNVNPSLFMRIPFTVTDPTDMDRLMLYIRSDDGFIAYLNGEEVTRRNAAPNSTHDSTATLGRHDQNSVVERTIELTGFRHLIKEGENVLAVHVLNASADDPDLLFSARLEPLLSQEYTSREWRAVRDSLFSNYFPQRSAIVLDQFRAAGLFVDGPQFSQHGGEIEEGFELSMAGIGGRIYYTTDGSDPRISTFGREAEGTAVSPSAVLYSEPVALGRNQVVKARAFIPAGDMNLSGDVSVDDIAPLVQALVNPSAYRAAHHGIPPNVAGDLDGDNDFDFDDVTVFRSLMEGTGTAAEPGQWSALVEAAFSAGPPEVRISEIMYHPEAPPAGSSFEDNDYEYIELVNISESVIDLGGLRFTQGIAFEFAAATMLAPGERILVVRSLAAFQERYGTEVRVAGQYGGTPEDYKLSNGGETLRLEDAQGRVIQEFAYDDAWYGQTDGDGFSLEVIDPFALPLDEWGLRDSWRASPERGGSPGRAE
jgi:hypothetical protein